MGSNRLLENIEHDNEKNMEKAAHFESIMHLDLKGLYTGAGL